MILLWLVLIPLIGGILAWLQSRRSPHRPRWIALAAIGLDLLLALVLWGQHAGQVTVAPDGGWLVLFDVPWIPQLGVSLLLGLDGLSLLLVLLTAFLGIAAVVASWTEIR
ncbi:MAG TPA: hypothetical protein VNH46_12440, partial [Gemmatimonadales bacterium]|nr:hypothetical protein [Gemmatimonadales bacterium]